MKTHTVFTEQFEIACDVSNNQECVLYCITAWHIFRLQIEEMASRYGRVIAHILNKHW